jgi:arginase
MAGKQVSIIGVPLDLGAGHRGVDMGPSAIRIAGLQARLRKQGHDVVDFGDVACAVPETREPRDPKLRFLREIVESLESLADAVASVVRDDRFPVVLGGDHSIAMGTMGGLARVHPRQGLIYFDAHGDYNTPTSSPSGNIHGMPVSGILGVGDERLCNLAGVNPKAIDTNTVLIGLRDVDPAEAALLRASKVKCYTLRDIDEVGMGTVVREAIAIASDGVEHVHCSFDLDVIDPQWAPGTGTPVQGGITLREAHLAMEIVHDSGVVTSFEVAEMNPIIDNHNQTAELAVKIIASALGKSIV